MKTSRKLIFIALGTIGLMALTIAALILFFHILLNVGLSSQYMGEAYEEDRIAFEEHYEDFQTLNNFIIEDYDTNRKLTKSRYYQRYGVDTEKGDIEAFIAEYEDSSATKTLSLKINEKVRNAIKNINACDFDFATIHATDNRIDYGRGDNLVYTRDDSTPTYMSESDEKDPGYLMYKLRNNWYYMVIP